MSRVSWIQKECVLTVHCVLSYHALEERYIDTTILPMRKQSSPVVRFLAFDHWANHLSWQSWDIA